MKGLEVFGVLEYIFLILISDNGFVLIFECKWIYGLWGVKNSLYEGGIKMFFIIYWLFIIEVS